MTGPQQGTAAVSLSKYPGEKYPSENMQPAPAGQSYRGFVKAQIKSAATQTRTD